MDKLVKQYKAALKTQEPAARQEKLNDVLVNLIKGVSNARTTT